MMIRFCLAVLLLLFLFSCKTEKKQTLFTLLDKTGIDFSNSLTETPDFNVFKYRNFYNGGGVAAGDLNNDGLTDLFFTSNQGSNQLYINKDNLQFENVSDKAGFSQKKQWSTGVVLVDINNDGWLDIYVCNAGNLFEPELRKNQLFINNHDLTFTEKAADYGLADNGYTTHASFFDYDLDGDLDCFIINNSPIPVNALETANVRDSSMQNLQIADFLKFGGDHLYRNDNGRFTEVTKQAGLHGGLISLGLGVTVADINADGYPDVYVSNDFFERDYLYINQKNGTFKDELETRTQHISLSSMGADIQDINNDGHPDIFTTDMLPADEYRLKTTTSFDSYDVYRLRKNNGFFHQYTQNALQVNNGNGQFHETGFYSGVAASDWSWGALMFDADNDGLADIYVCNGIYRDVTDQDFIDFFANDVIQQMAITGKKEDVGNITNKMPSNPIANSAFQNKGKLKFSNAATEWGLDEPTFSNGAVYADLDNDGDLELIVNNVNQPALIYKNNSREQNGHHYIAVQLQHPANNTFAIGSVIRVYSHDSVLVREVMPARGFQSSVDYKQIIGLGNAQPDSVTITWPDQSSTTLVKPAINQLHTINYSSSQRSAKPAPALQKKNVLFTMVNTGFEKHNEDDYVDFYAERNVPFMLSRLGPKGAVADVNADGLEDIYIGGARGQAGQLYLQTASGFIRKDVADFATFSFNDVTVAFFFDCDKDGDQDLFVGGGGNHAPSTPGNYLNQLFINDGSGNFTLKRGALPATDTNCGAAVAFDFNGDGWNDLFIGSRSVPQNYGELPASFLLQNDGNGNFTDVTASVAPQFRQLGMITAAVTADLNADGKQELMVTGEWMQPQLFSFNGTQMQPLETGLTGADGFWQTLSLVDVDNDGDLDLLLGNIGENFYLRPTLQQPVKLWVADIDNNGINDKLMSYTQNGKDMPVFTKREATDQVPALKKMNLKHHEYATKTAQQLLGTTAIQPRLVNNVSSCIAYNNGKGQFTLQPLPYQVQLSSVNAFTVADINADGFPDIICGGNFYDLLPQFCRIDASAGHVLLNDQKGGFTYMSSFASGVMVNGQVRDIQQIQVKNKTHLLFLRNDETPVLYQLQSAKQEP